MGNQAKRDARPAVEAAILRHKGRWRRRTDPARSTQVRVMTVVEHYVVARFTGAAPFLRHVDDWYDEFESVTETAR